MSQATPNGFGPEPRWTRRTFLRRALQVSGGLTLGGMGVVGCGAQVGAIRVAPGDSIQTAVERAAAGGEVVVEPGVYRETIIVDKPLTLRSAGGAPVTVLRADEDAFVWRGVPINDLIVGAVNVVRTEDVTVEGFTVTDALEGIWLSVCLNCVVRDCVSYRNTSSGYYFWASQDCLLEGSLGADNAVGVYEGQSGNVTIQGSTFRLNKGGVAPHLGGGDGLRFPGIGILSGNQSAGGDILNCRCEANTEAGIQINMADRNKTIRGCHVSLNRVGMALGIRVERVERNNILGNAEFGLEAFREIDARDNWWGHPSGPAGSAGGQGDRASDSVLVEPWLREPVEVPESP